MQNEAIALVVISALRTLEMRQEVEQYTQRFSLVVVRFGQIAGHRIIE